MTLIMRCSLVAAFALGLVALGCAAPDGGSTTDDGTGNELVSGDLSGLTFSFSSKGWATQYGKPDGEPTHFAICGLQPADRYGIAGRGLLVCRDGALELLVDTGSLVGRVRALGPERNDRAGVSCKTTPLETSYRQFECTVGGEPEAKFDAFDEADAARLRDTSWLPSLASGAQADAAKELVARLPAARLEGVRDAKKCSVEVVPKEDALAFRLVQDEETTIEKAIVFDVPTAALLGGWSDDTHAGVQAQIRRGNGADASLNRKVIVERGDTLRFEIVALDGSRDTKGACEDLRLPR